MDKLIPNELLAVLKKSGESLGGKLNAKSKNAQLKILQHCDELLRVFAKGRQAIKEFFTKLADDIGTWLVRNRKLVSLVTEEELLAFAKANRLKVVLQDVQTIIKLTGGRRNLAEGILLSLQEVIEGKTVLELVKRFRIKEIPLKNSLSNYQARIWYTWRKMQIEKIISRIPKLEDKAKKAFELRNEYRTATRQHMKDKKLANYLEQVEKNMEWDFLLERTLNKKGVNTLEEAYYDIIEKSMSGRDGVDKLFKIDK